MCIRDRTSDEATFTTEKIIEVPNLNFDTWTQDGKNWYPNPVADNYEDPQAYWATGNEGVTCLLYTFFIADMPELFLMSGCAGTQAAGDMSWIVVPVLFIRLPILQSSI